jgi:hypothetical protein
MEVALKQIWEWMGIPQVWGAILTLLVLVIGYLLKRLVDQRMEKQRADLEALTNQFADIAEFVKEQSTGLITAYVKLFERKEAIDARGKQFMELVADADNDLMKPLRKYQAKLDDETKAKIFNIHNILAQYYPDASDEAIEEFKTRRAEFYARIEDAQRFLRPDLILYRLGVVSRKLQERGQVRQ